MNSYHSAAADDQPQQDWVPSLPSQTLSYHATLESHHHTQPHLSSHTHSHGHHGPSNHTHTYPSQHLTASLVDHVAPILESPSFSQDRESLHSEPHDDENHSTANTTPHNSMPPLPSYQLALCSLPSQHSGFKRPYQPDIITPASSPQPSKRRKSTSKEAWTMTEDDNLLLKLKDDEGLPWKAIACRFRDMNRGEFRVPTLQMRYKRLKEKLRVWDAEDIQYLKEAKEHIEKTKWELISARMLELGCKKKIPGNTCEKKWKEICPQPINTQQLPGSGPNSASTNSATSTLSDGLLSACDMKRELSQVSEEDVEGLGVSVSIDGRE